MMDAEVGDDVFGDDPTVLELEALTATMFEKQAGLLVPSGTMGNLIAVMAHCERRGSEMIVGMKNHLVGPEGCVCLAGCVWLVLPAGSLRLASVCVCHRQGSVRVTGSGRQ